MNSYEVAGRVCDALQSEYPDIDICLVGGTVMDPAAEVADGKTFLTEGANKPTLRDDGSLRDLDLIALTSDQRLRNQIRGTAAEAASGEMEIAVFGLGKYHERGAAGRALAHMTHWVSRREIDADGVVHHSLFPFAAPVPEAAFKHRLVFPNGQEAATFSPTYSVISYMLRSIGGIRPRDEVKVDVQRSHLQDIGLWVPENPAEDTPDQAQYRVLLGIADGVSHLGQLSIGKTILGGPTAWRSRIAHTYDSNEIFLKLVHNGGEDLLRRLGFMR